MRSRHGAMSFPSQTQRPAKTRRPLAVTVGSRPGAGCRSIAVVAAWRLFGVEHGEQLAPLLPEEADGRFRPPRMLRLLALGCLLAAACSTSPAPDAQPVVAAPIARDGAQVRIVRLVHVLADLVAEIVVDVLDSSGPGVGPLKVTTKQGENAVVVSAPPEQLREALDLIARLDVPGAR